MLSKLRHPVRAIREPFGTAGLILACVALIAALTGGAYAASGGLTAKQKKEVKKIAKQFAGKPGAPGATGAPGAKGDTGAAGTNGTSGTNGTNGLRGARGEAGMCSEEEPECVLPAGGVLTGTWSVAGGPSDFGFATISFPLRVHPAPTAILEDPAKIAGRTLGWELKNGKLVFVGPYGTFAEIQNAPDPEAAIFEDADAYSAACPGKAAEPEAEPGFLCIYIRGSEQVIAPFGEPALEAKATAADEFGVTVPWKTTAESGGGYVRGTWAVGS